MFHLCRVRSSFSRRPVVAPVLGILIFTIPLLKPVAERSGGLSHAQAVPAISVNAGLTVSPAAPGDPLFGPPTDIDILNGGKNLIVDDFNKDGLLDAGTVVTVNNSSMFAYLRGDPTNVLNGPSLFPFIGQGDTLVGDDVDGDGNKDVLGASPNGGANDVVGILYGDPTGDVFSSPQIVSTDFQPKQITTADFNRDGKKDIATLQSTSIVAKLNQGNRTFGPPIRLTPAALFDVFLVTDFNRDGNEDFLVADGTEVKIFKGNGDGSFQNPETIVNLGEPIKDFSPLLPTYEGFGDVNDFHAVTQSGEIHTFLFDFRNRTPLVFRSGNVNETPSNPRALPTPTLSGVSQVVYESAASGVIPRLAGESSESNRDASRTAATTEDTLEEDDDTIKFVNFAGDGTVQGSAQIVGPGTRDFEFGDFNRDGLPDIVTFLPGTTKIRIYPNVTPLGCDAPDLAASATVTAANADSVTTADFNLDSLLDVATARNGGANGIVSVAFGNGDGTFDPPTDFAVGNGPNAVVTDDFNRDGLPDLATADTTANTISVLLNNGAGGFGAATAFTTGAGSQPRGLAVGDLNKDGKPDLVVASSGTNQIGVLLGTGTGAFGAVTNFLAGLFPASVVVADLDSDGNPDVAAANRDGNTVSYRLGNGAGGLGGQFVDTVGTQPRSITAADLNRDGSLDLVTANTGATNLSILFNDGFANFAPDVRINAGTSPHSVQSADVNQDGKPDLIAVNGGTSNLSVLSGDGAGAFGAPTTFPVGTGNFEGNQIAVADFDRDLRPDFAKANSTTGTVSVLVNACAGDAPPCPTLAGTLAGGGTICPAATATVTVTITQGEAPFTVTLTNGGGTKTGASPLVFTVSPAGTTTFAVQSATDNAGCPVTVTGTAQVTVLTTCNGASLLFAADTQNHRVQKFDGQTWTVVVGNGVPGFTPNRCNLPEAVAASIDGQIIFVADTGNNRIIFSTDGGTNWAVFAASGFGLNQVSAPQGVALDAAGNLYVSDTGNRRVLRFAGGAPSNATVLANEGLGAGQVKSPRGLATDAAGTLFVADKDNNRIMRIANAAAAGLNAGTVFVNGAGFGLTQVSGPEGVAPDTLGNLLVADTGNNRVIRFPLGGGAGTVLTAGLGAGLGFVNKPEGVAVARFAAGPLAGQLLAVVGDTGGNRVQGRPLAGGAFQLIGAPNNLGSLAGQFRSPSKLG